MVADEEPVLVSDALLLRRFYEGDEASFTTLFQRHYDMVYGVLYRLTGTRREAEDLAQEVFVKLYQRSLRRDENIAGWLYRVAVNTGYNALRSARRRDQREQAVSQDQAAGPRTEDEVTRRETQVMVRRTLAEIAPRSAKILVLREMDFSYEEIAEIIGVAPGSVGTLLARARKEFRAAYAREGEGHENATSV